MITVSPASLADAELNSHRLRELAEGIEGTLRTDSLHRIVYATDASAYQELPLGVAVPHDTDDLKKIVRHAARHHVPLIMRGAGTSLAGQVVGRGLMVDLRNLGKILEFSPEGRWVRVQPGVVRNHLNDWLAPHRLLFGPETSTANRAMIGGMIGNNSCGMHSIVWGSTRDHLLACKALLADGSEVEFRALSPDEFHKKRELPTLEGGIYRLLYERLSDPEQRRAITTEYPKPSIRRRNTGYAVDLLLRSNVFTPGGPDFNMCSLVAGSEGTLCVVTEATLNLVPPLPPAVGCVAMHFNDNIESLRATLVALSYKPTACELFGDFHVRQVTENNKVNDHNIIARNSRWIEGSPQSIVVVEFSEATRRDVETKAAALTAELERRNMGYAWPFYFGDEVERIWTLRRAIGGINSSRPGDLKYFDLIEDSAVDVEDQPEYVRQLEEKLRSGGVQFTQSAHVGDGELHTIVFLNPKTKEGVRLYRWLLETASTLVKSFRGSLSGEHGDGRMRAEFLPKMIGERNYQLCCAIKETFDPAGILNPNKIVHALPCDVSLRYSPQKATPELATYFNWDRDLGIVRAVERCNGMAECKKLREGTMCPSYRATREEKDTPRARANILREYLTNSRKANPFDHEEIREVLDLCIGCKACKSECSAGVDIAKAKAEFLQHYHDVHRPRLRTHLIAHFARLMRLASVAAPLFNLLSGNELLARPFKWLVGFAPARSLPAISAPTLADWYRRGDHGSARPNKVHLLCDEFTDLNDAEIGIAAVKLFERLGYEVDLVHIGQSGRALISQGFLRAAKVEAERNVRSLADVVTDDAPLIAIEPSAISCFIDEYADLVSPQLRAGAVMLAGRSYMFEDFILREMEHGRISADAFTDEPRTVHVHVHCHQKALSSAEAVARVLALPRNYTVKTIPSGCCGMAGAFGYEAEHHDVSMRIAEEVLLPAVRRAPPADIIAASGTSCRHQIKDGTDRRARHTAEILHEALRPAE
ncbi:FAD-linked oxidase C-terminal domain-containing protein [Xanthobacteraceae bacterium Astr-EGSB]|uniref:FAD-binding and (Fe-S)-binding domain-containing protein n=1 Tax=Astrobacterium formosum TaxID=3069710 RepID=UPI0027B61ED7|nr:FAD-linked oxidase C-terminal domain-containing protein [Xanthobacteraceae bacterium Astr-EGSB]